jgi:RHS repeat-associated protein
MTTRGTQTLTYDAQNQIIQVSTTNDTVNFGYDDSGERLWRAGTNGYTVWIGGIYEINDGKILCHVIAGGKLIATFEPECNAGLVKVIGQKNWYVASSILSWPLHDGRGQWTVFGGTWAMIFIICLVGSRGIRLRRVELQRLDGIYWLWRQAVTLMTISAFLWVGTGNVDAAPIYNPVFYFYSTDYLGSSNVLTDNSGNLVQHYEYSTFGQASYRNNTSAFPVSSRYTGQIADDETGLLYYGGRYYDPQLGRFIQPDPEIPDPMDSQSFNRYSYCRNNPLNEIDPSGLTDAFYTTDPYSTYGVPTMTTQNEPIKQQFWDGFSAGFFGQISGGLGALWGGIEGGISNFFSGGSSASRPSTAPLPGDQVDALLSAHLNLIDFSGLTDAVQQQLIWRAYYWENKAISPNGRFGMHLEEYDGTDYIGPAADPERIAGGIGWSIGPGLSGVNEMVLTMASFEGQAGTIMAAEGPAVTVYRVEGSQNERIIIGEDGQVSVQGDGMLHLNFGNTARAEQWLAKDLRQQWPGAQMKSFQVPQSFLTDLRENAVPQSMGRLFPTRPQLVDTTKAPDQFGLQPAQIQGLRNAIIQGTGKVH